MSLRKLLTIVIMLLPACALAANDNARSAIPAFLAPGKVYDYKVQIVLDGQSRLPGSDTSQAINATLDLTIRQKNTKGITDGEVQSVMSVQAASLATGGEKIQLMPSTFPQVTVLIDKSGKVKKVLGGSGPGMPGLNFSNFMLILLPNIPQADASLLKEGEQWTREATLNDTGQIVKVVSTFKGWEKIKNLDTISVQQAFEMLPPKEDAPKGDTLIELKGTAVSNFLAQGYKPVKSSAEMQVVGTLAASPSMAPVAKEDGKTQKDKGEFRAKVSINLEALK